jgi:uncharacterized protein (DUF488 family)
MDPGLRRDDNHIFPIPFLCPLPYTYGMQGKQPAIYTIGHSTHKIEEFIAMLRAHGIKQLVDIRSLPVSHYNPQFNIDALKAPLAAETISYLHMKSLGGLRKARADSINTGFRDGGFRGYADYMQTPEFATALSELITKSRARRTVIMCAEAKPTQCHRSLVSDALAVRDIPAVHIFSEAKTQPHTLTDFAEIAGEQITYPSREPQFKLS